MLMKQHMIPPQFKPWNQLSLEAWLLLASALKLGVPPPMGICKGTIQPLSAALGVQHLGAQLLRIFSTVQIGSQFPTFLPNAFFSPSHTCWAECAQQVWDGRKRWARMMGKSISE